ncbi:hypothetical protein P4O66_008130, partial [Electrophorus voltai]
NRAGGAMTAAAARSKTNCSDVTEVDSVKETPPLAHKLSLKHTLTGDVKHRHLFSTSVVIGAITVFLICLTPLCGIKLHFEENGVRIVVNLTVPQLICQSLAIIVCDLAPLIRPVTIRLVPPYRLAARRRPSALTETDVRQNGSVKAQVCVEQTCRRRSG